MNRMDRQVFDYSMKNVPIPSERLVQLEFLNSIHKLSKKMSWRAKRHLQPELFQNKKETYSLNTSKAPPYIEELKFFHNELCDLAKNLKFRKFHNNFHNKLNKDLNNIRNDNKVIIKADKTRN